ncbi:MAG: alpha-L-rhamnosidase C-terminal domain-containing protein [Spirosomataceae bacterium]
MNSFNHYAFGSICEWMFENMAGIKETTPGFKTFLVQPEWMTANINSLKATHRSINGTIGLAWQKKGDIITITVEVPINTTATICLPPAPINAIFLNGRVLTTAAVKAKAIGFREQNTVTVGSGKYVLTFKKSALSGF